MKFANFVQSFLTVVFRLPFKLPELIRWMAKKAYTKNLSFLVGLFFFVLTYALLPHSSGPPMCNDGWASPSIGTQGACSGHSGVKREHSGIKFFFSVGIGYLASYLYGRRRDAVRQQKSEEGKPTLKGSLHKQDKPSTDPRALFKCPLCGSSMGIRLMKNGGKQWVCRRSSVCSGVRPFG